MMIAITLSICSLIIISTVISIIINNECVFDEIGTIGDHSSNSTIHNNNSHTNISNSILKRQYLKPRITKKDNAAVAAAAAAAAEAWWFDSNEDDEYTILDTIVSFHQQKERQNHRNLHIVQQEFQDVRLRLSNHSLTEEHSISWEGVPVPLSIAVTGTNIYCRDIQRDTFFVQMDLYVEIRSSDEYDDYPFISVAYHLKNVNAEIVLAEQFREDFFVTLRFVHQESFYDIFPCLLLLSYNFSNPNIHLISQTISRSGDDKRTIISETTTPKLYKKPSTLVDFLWSDLGVSYVAGTPIRNLIHEALISSVNQANCPRHKEGKAYLDFRDFFLSGPASIALGGNGNLPYGVLGTYLFNMVQQLTSIDENDNTTRKSRLGLNNVVEAVAAAQSSLTNGTMVDPRFNFTYKTDNQEGVFFEALQRSTFKYYDIMLFFLRVWNLDTFIAPTSFLEPTSEEFSLSNVCSFGVPGRPLSGGFTLKTSGAMVHPYGGGTTRTFQNEIDIFVTIDSLQVETEFAAMFPLNDILRFPVGDTTNLYCWAALLSDNIQYNETEPFNNINITESLMLLNNFHLTFNSLSVGSKCLNCTSFAFIETLPNLLRNLTKAQNSTWDTRFALLAEEIVLSNETIYIINEVLYQSRQFCPHRPEYNEFKLVMVDLPYQLPLLSTKSIDTGLYASMLFTELLFVVYAEILYEESKNLQQNESMVLGMEAVSPEESMLAFLELRSKPTDVPENSTTSELPQLLNSSSSNDTLQNGTHLLDWTKLNETAPMIHFFVNEIADRFGTVDPETGELGINKFMKNGLQIEDGVFEVLLNDIDLAMMIAGIELRIYRVQIEGLDSFTSVDSFKAISPDVILCAMQMDKFKFSMEYTARHLSNPSHPQNITLTADVRDINVSLPISMLLDTEVFSALQFGSLLQLSDVVPCLLSVARKIYFPRMLIQVGEFFKPQIKGLMDETSLSMSKSIDIMFSALFETNPTKINDVTRFFFDTIVRDFVNEFFFISIENSRCVAPALANESYVNFSEMFRDLSWSAVAGELDSDYDGGQMAAIYGRLFDYFTYFDDRQIKLKQSLFGPSSSDDTDPLSDSDNEDEMGDSVYGNVPAAFKSWINSGILSVDNSTGLSNFNEYLVPLTKAQSGEEGTISWEGILFGMSNISLWNLFGVAPQLRAEDEVNVTFYVSDFRFENINSLGVSTFLEPNTTSQYLIDNEFSIGVGPNPFRTVFKLFLAIEGVGDSTNTQNLMEFDVNFDNVKVLAVMFAKLRSKELLTYPLLYALDSDCWAQLFVTNGGPITEPALNFKHLDIEFKNIWLNMTCLDCANAALRELPSLLIKIENVLKVLSERWAIFSVELARSVMDVGIVDQFLFEKAKNCTRPGVEVTTPKENKVQSYPPISKESIETVVFAWTFVMQMGVYFLVYSSTLEDALQPIKPPTSPPTSYPAANLIDISKAHGMDGLFRRVNAYLTSPIQNSNGSFQLMVNSLISDALGGNPLKIVGTEFVTLDLGQWILEISHFRVSGLDSFNDFDIANITGPQTFQSRFGWRNLEFELAFVVKKGQFATQTEAASNDMLSFSSTLKVEDIKMSPSTFVALEEGRLGELRLGSILVIENLFPCMLDVINDLRLTELNVDAEKIGVVKVRGFEDPEIIEKNAELEEKLQEVLGDKLVESLYSIFDDAIRGAVNKIAEYYIASDETCPHPLTGTGDFVDFRDLLLQPAIARFHGGSGMTPYGLWVQKIYSFVEDFITRDIENSREFQINSLLVLLLNLLGRGGDDTVRGSFNFLSDCINFNQPFWLNGKLLEVEVKLSDMSVQNVFTLGTPWKLLDITSGAPFQLNNTITFGVGNNPLRLRFRGVLGLRWNGEIATRNDVEITLSFHSLSLILDALVKISEQKFMGFPLLNYNNMNCLIGLLLGCTHDNDDRSAIMQFAMSATTIGLNFRCHNCTSSRLRDLEEYLASHKLSFDVTQIGNGLLGNIVPNIGRIISKDFIHRTGCEAERRCMVKNKELEIDVRPNVTKSHDEQFYESESRQMDILVVAACLVAALLAGLVIHAKPKFSRGQKWSANLPTDGLDALREQQRRRQARDREVDMMTTGMIHASEIPKNVRRLIPFVLIGDICLVFCGHYFKGIAANVTVDIAGEAIHAELLKFSMSESVIAFLYTKDKMMTFTKVISFAFSIIWPYIQNVAIFLLWYLPPRHLSTSLRGSILSWLNVLAKWSMAEVLLVIVVMASLRTSISSPKDKFLPENLYSADLALVPLRGFYEQWIAQMVSHAMLYTTIRYNKQIIHNATLRFSSNGTPSSSEELNKSKFWKLHNGRFEQLEVPPKLNCMVKISLIVLWAFTIMSFVVPCVSFETLGFVGLAKEFGEGFGETTDVYSVFGVIEMLIADKHLGNHPGLYFSCLALCFTLLVVPMLILSTLSFVWFLPTSREKKVSLLNAIEILSSWHYNEIFLFAVIGSIWEAEAISSTELNLVCGDINEPLALLAHYDFLEKRHLLCFRRSAKVEVGFYMIFISIFSFFWLKGFVVMAAQQYLWQCEEEDLLEIEEIEVTEPNDSVTDDDSIAPLPAHFTYHFGCALRGCAPARELFLSEMHQGDDNINEIVEGEWRYPEFSRHIE